MMYKYPINPGAALLVGLIGLNANVATACSESVLSLDKACRQSLQERFEEQGSSCELQKGARAVKRCYNKARKQKSEALALCAKQADAREQLCQLLGDDRPYAPNLDPGRFLSAADIAANPNPYFPLIPGTIYVYAGDEGKVTVTISDETRVIVGIDTIAVRDLEADESGQIQEDTIDWYAQDIGGNVWYFGEDSREFEDGEWVTEKGSWMTGKDGALPGIIMLAEPEVGVAYRQEVAWGEAEDAGEVISLDGEGSVPAADCQGACLIVRDFNPLEPEANELKYYAPGIGLILEVEFEDGEAGDRLELMEVINP